MRFPVYAALAIITLSLQLPGTAAAQCWKLLWPASPRETLNAVRHITPSDCLAVGDGGTVMRSADSGHTWTVLRPFTYEHLQSISFPTLRTGWIGATNGRLFHSTDSGFSFQPVASFRDSITIASISFRSSDTGYVAGDSCIWRTYDAGLSWTKCILPATGTGGIAYVEAFRGDTVLAHRSGALLRSYDKGQTWNALSVPATILHVDFLDPRKGWASEGTSISATTDGGLTWTQQYANRNLGKLQVLDASHVFALMNIGIGGYRGVIFTQNGGATWTIPSSGNLNPGSLDFSSALNGLVGMEDGSVASTEDGGYTYTARAGVHLNTQEAGGTRDMHFSDSLHGTRASTNVVWHTRNGGRNWAPSVTLPFNIFPRTVRSVDSTHLWVIGDTRQLLSSSSSGRSWNLVLGANTTNDVAFYDTAFGIRASDSGLFLTRNAGLSWTPVLRAAGIAFGKVACIDSLHWVATNTPAGTEFLYKSADAGQTWSGSYFLGYSLGINDLQPIDTLRIYAGTFNSVGRLTNGTGPMTLVYPTASPALKIIQEARISFYDSLHGLACSGYLGGGYWRHAVLAATGDGGQSWQDMPVPTRYAITGIRYNGPGDMLFANQAGAIYKYHPSCPLDSNAPVLSRSAYYGCGGKPFSLRIANFFRYTAGDTLTAALKLGSATVLTPAISASGGISFMLPLTGGAYELEVTLVNKDYPQGVIRRVPLGIRPQAFVNVFRWPAADTATICAADSFQIGFTAGIGFGLNFRYELHMIGRSGVDSVIDYQTSYTTLRGLRDTVRLYYRMLLRDSTVCSQISVFNGDTLTLRVIPAAQPQTSLSTYNAVQTICEGDSISILTQSRNAGILAPWLEFHRIANGRDTVFQTGGADRLFIPALQDTSLFYVRMAPGFGGPCIYRDTVFSDTMIIRIIPRPPLAPLLGSNRINHTICGGDSIVITVQTALPGVTKRYQFFMRISGRDSLLQDNSQSAVLIKPLRSGRVFCRVSIPGQVCGSVDSPPLMVVANVTPSTPYIQRRGDTLTTAFVPGFIYTWYRNGGAITGVTGPLLIPSDTGTYTVSYVQDGCSSPQSDPLWFEPGALYAASWKGSVIHVYPNPVQDFLYVESAGAVVSAVLYDALGRAVLRENVMGQQGFRLSMQLLPAGIYSLMISGAEGQRQVWKISRRGL